MIYWGLIRTQNYRWSLGVEVVIIDLLRYNNYYLWWILKLQVLRCRLLKIIFCGKKLRIFKSTAFDSIQGVLIIIVIEILIFFCLTHIQLVPCCYLWRNRHWPDLYLLSFEGLALIGLYWKVSILLRHINWSLLSHFNF